MGKKSISEWTQNQIGKKSLQLSGFGFFLLSLHLHAIKRKRKSHTCLHIDTIEKSDSCFSELLPLHNLQVAIRYRGSLLSGSWL